jgi:hypothetical protein
MTWEELSTLPPLRDATGTIMLEEADDDTRTATFRVYGRRSLTATLAPDGTVRFDGEVPPVLRAATIVEGSERLIATPPSGGRGKWVAAGVAACGVAALAVRRRR